MFQLQRRSRGGFGGNVSYVFAKAIDDALGSVVAQNWLNLTAERALSSGVRQQTLNVRMQWSDEVGEGPLSMLKGKKGALIRGWTVTTNITVAGGAPLTPVLPLTVRGTGVTGSERPDLTGASIYAVTPGSGLYLNPTAFIAPPPGQWGNAGRNIITGPGQVALNSSLQRNFRFGERRDCDFRVDATNVLNHVTFPNWNTTIGSAQFGLPNSANGMRVLQANLRFTF